MALCSLLLLSLSAAPTPRLLFSAADLPALRAKAREAGWQRWLTEQRRSASEFSDPRAANYADPAKVGLSTWGDRRPQVTAHEYGRRLTNQLETLGLVYQLDGVAVAGQHGARLLVAAAQELPITRADVAGSFAGARGDLLRAYAVGYDLVGECLTPPERGLVDGLLASYIENMLVEAEKPGTWWMPHHNFCGVGLGGAGLAALCLQDRDARAAGWLARVDSGLRRWFEGGFDAHGAGVEGTGYALYGLDNSVTYAVARQRLGGPDLLDQPRLRLVPRFFCQQLLPGEMVFEARNDANYEGLRTPLMLALANAWNDPLARWLDGQADSNLDWRRLVWARAGAVTDPAAAGLPLDDHFEGRGLTVHRTGWGAADTLLAVEAGRFFPVTHNQSDKGHFTFYSHGQRWAIDSGYGNNREPAGRCASLAHNLVLIDGQGQTLAGAGAGNDGAVVAFQPGPQVSRTTTDAAPAWRGNSARQVGLPVERALRHTLLARPSHGVPAYAVIADDLRLDAQPHEFTWLLHSGGANQVELLPDGCRLRPVDPGTDYLQTPLGSAAGGAAVWRLPNLPAGRYALHGLVRALPPELAKTDSFVVVAGGRTVQWHCPSSAAWVWGRVADGVPAKEVWFDLPSGPTSIELRTREAGAMLAKLVLTPAATWQPSGPAAETTAELLPVAATVAAPMARQRVDSPPVPTCRVYLTAAAAVRGTVDGYDGHPRYQATLRAVEPRTLAFLIPVPPGLAEPRLERAADGAVTLHWAGRTDRWTWPAGAPPSGVISP
ncbi:MAG: heparinase II/III family protein [Fimbriimonadaceae bacterium]|nr:heparinase II/III family protein [Fimbriimonadaceae bacterium]